MDELNRIELPIDYTYELETNNTLPSLGILLAFKVYRKSSNKKYHIHLHFEFRRK